MRCANALRNGSAACSPSSRSSSRDRNTETRAGADVVFVEVVVKRDEQLAAGVLQRPAVAAVGGFDLGDAAARADDAFFIEPQAGGACLGALAAEHVVAGVDVVLTVVPVGHFVTDLGIVDLRARHV